MKTSKKTLYTVLIAASACVFVFSVYRITERLYGYYHDNRQYSKLRENVESANPQERFSSAFEITEEATFKNTQNKTGHSVSETSTEESKEPEYYYSVIQGDSSELNQDGIFCEYAQLAEQNSHMVGWIHIPGYIKKIDYPVMHSEDNVLYLHRDFYGNYSYAGSIFMDYRNDSSAPGRHIILYGHAMNDKSMFGNLKQYPQKPEYHTSKTKIYLDLLNTRLEYEVFSTYYCDASDNYRQVHFNTDKSYMSFLSQINERSVYEYGARLLPTDKILTISTCNNLLGKDTRSVIHARLARQITYESQNSNTNEQNTTKTSKKAVSANVYLLELSLTYSEADNTVNAQFDPPFNTILKNFSTEIPADAQNITLDVKPADPRAHLSVTLNGENTEPGKILLNQPKNTIKIKVTSRQWEYARTYTVVVNKKEYE